jgi:hypothetical protein
MDVFGLEPMHATIVIVMTGKDKKVSDSSF